MASCLNNCLLVFFIFCASSKCSDVGVSVGAGDPESVLSDTFNFHPDYWKQVERAIRIAQCLKNEVKPALDVLSLIMKPAACKKYSTLKNCSNCLKVAENFDGGAATHLFTNFHQSENSPKPVFHCNRHVWNPRHDYETHFRLEYTKDGGLPSNLRDEDLPRIFVVEKQEDGIWVSVSIQYYWIFPIDTQSGKTYRLRITCVTPDLVHYPVESDPITLYDVPTLGTPRNVRQVSQKVSRKAARPTPTVMLRWESGSGMNSSCDFDIYYMGDSQYKVERYQAEDAFWVILGRLQFEGKYEVQIIEKFGYRRESQPARNFITVKSCLELTGFDVDLCSPPPPKNIRIENETSETFLIVWDKSYPVLHNFTYTIVIEKISSGLDSPSILTKPQRVFQTIVPGNQTQVEVPSIQGVGKIVVVGTSSGGKSEERAIVHHFEGGYFLNLISNIFRFCESLMDL